MRIVSEEAQRNPKRLTLEILGAIGVIAVLAGVLYPVYTDGDNGRKRMCLSRLKQLSLASINYSADSDDTYPPYFTFDGHDSAQRFVDVTESYSKTKDAFMCPQDTDSIQENQEGLLDKMTYVHSLALRGTIPDFPTGKRAFKQSDVKAPEAIAYVRDPIRGYGLPKAVNSQPPQDGKPHFFSPHGERFTVGYLDGHVRARTPIDEFMEL